MDDDIGLMDYKARFYSLVLNRFIQPDSIVPGMFNPQTLNRFSYVSNSPINFNDPTGHRQECSDGPKTWAACKQQLSSFASGKLKELGGVDDLKAMTQIIDKAASLYGNYEDMIPALTYVFSGVEESNPWTIVNAKNSDACVAIGRSIRDQRNAGCENITPQFYDQGFHEDYRDGDNQLFHFWSYFSTSANIEGNGPLSFIPGVAMSFIGNEVHEKYAPLIAPDHGARWQDYALTYKAMKIGYLVNIGVISPNQLGSYIKNELGTQGQGTFWVEFYKQTQPLSGN